MPDQAVNATPAITPDRAAVNPWDAVVPAARYGRPGDNVGITLTPLPAAQTVVFSLPRGADAVRAIAGPVRDVVGSVLPPMGQVRRIAGAPGTIVAWDGPGRYRWLHLGDAARLANGATPAGDRAADCVAALQAIGVAAVDQSHGQSVALLAGDAVPAVLGRGTSLDVHPAAFPVGSSAVTTFSHHGCHLALLDETPTWVLSTARSTLGSFTDALLSAASEFGVRIVHGDSAAPGQK